jgi:hypothetical protein
LSFPIRRRKYERFGWRWLTGIYVVCLECGKEFDYDWNQMKVVQTSGKRRRVKQKEIKAELEG